MKITGAALQLPSAVRLCLTDGLRISSAAAPPIPQTSNEDVMHSVRRSREDYLGRSGKAEPYRTGEPQSRRRIESPIVNAITNMSF
jgi:hypothetical protein